MNRRGGAPDVGSRWAVLTEPARGNRAGGDGAIRLWTSDGGGIRRCAPQSARSAG